MKYPKRVNIIELENAPFRCAKDAEAYAIGHGIVGVMSEVDTGGKGEVFISIHSLNKMLSGSALQKSVTPAIHYAALMRLRDIIRESFIGEVHPDWKKGKDNKRRPENGINPNVEIAVLYGCVSAAGIPYRAKTTLKLHKDPRAKDNQPTKAYSYEINNIEVLKGNCRTSVRPSNKTPMIDVDILLNGVCDVNGVPLLSEEFGARREERRGKSVERRGKSEEGRARSEEGRARSEERRVKREEFGD